MNSGWFTIGFILVALGIFGFISADAQSLNAVGGLFSGHNTIGGILAARQAGMIAVGFCVLGGLLCLAGLAMPGESATPERSETNTPDHTNPPDAVIVHPKKGNDVSEESGKNLDDIIIYPKKGGAHK